MTARKITADNISAAEAAVKAKAGKTTVTPIATRTELLVATLLSAGKARKEARATERAAYAASDAASRALREAEDALWDAKSAYEDALEALDQELTGDSEASDHVALRRGSY